MAFDGCSMDLATLFSQATTTHAQRKQIIREMVEVFEELHKNHLFHGDVKLENMLLGSEGHMKICDFDEGLFEHQEEETWQGNITWHYVSPKRRRREEELGHDAF